MFLILAFTVMADGLLTGVGHLRGHSGLDRGRVGRVAVRSNTHTHVVPHPEAF
jgi:hypothetical protein